MVPVLTVLTGCNMKHGIRMVPNRPTPTNKDFFRIEISIFELENCGLSNFGHPWYRKSLNILILESKIYNLEEYNNKNS